MKVTDFEIKRKGDTLYVTYPGLPLGVLKLTDGNVTVELFMDKFKNLNNLRKLVNRLKKKKIGSDDPDVISLFMELEDV